MSNASTIDSTPEATSVLTPSDSAESGLPRTANKFILDSSVPYSVTVSSLRKAARMNALHVSDDEYSKLMSERAALLNKKYAGGISSGESARLEYVRWSLERIEDAKNGHVLDRIEDVAQRYRQALHDLQGLHQALASHLPRGKR